MSKKWILGVVCLVVVLLSVIYQLDSLHSNIRGTYMMEDNNKSIISFENDTFGEILYYYIDENQNQVEEVGTFEKQIDGKYKISCKSIRTDNAILKGKELTFEFKGQKYIFRKQGDLPVKFTSDK